VFCALVTGLVARTRLRTVTGMLVGAGMNLAWRHERAHRFFSRAVWCVDHVLSVTLGEHANVTLDGHARTEIFEEEERVPQGSP
jgi:hypothetical protein